MGVQTPPLPQPDTAKTVRTEPPNLHHQTQTVTQSHSESLDKMSSKTDWLVCGLCGAKVRQLFNNPSHRKLLARLLVQDIDKIPTKLCLVCTVKTQTVNEFQEFACKHLKLKTP